MYSSEIWNQADMIQATLVDMSLVHSLHFIGTYLMSRAWYQSYRWHNYATIKLKWHSDISNITQHKLNVCFPGILTYFQKYNPNMYSTWIQTFPHVPFPPKMFRSENFTFIHQLIMFGIKCIDKTQVLRRNCQKKNY
jgi:hypothetical protein